jgi:hypothetical protein
MSAETEWFEGNTNEQHERAYRYRVSGLLVLALAVLMALPGCAVVPKMPAAVPEKIVASFSAPHTQGTLYDERCDNPEVMKLVTAGLPPELVEKVKAARGTYEGKEYGVCWLWRPDEQAAIVIWDDGGHFAIPRQLLKFPVGV